MTPTTTKAKIGWGCYTVAVAVLSPLLAYHLYPGKEDSNPV